jgi:hypothetical protein
MKPNRTPNLMQKTTLFLIAPHQDRSIGHEQQMD